MWVALQVAKRPLRSEADYRAMTRRDSFVAQSANSQLLLIRARATGRTDTRRKRLRFDGGGEFRVRTISRRAAPPSVFCSLFPAVFFVLSLPLRKAPFPHRVAPPRVRSKSNLAREAHSAQRKMTARQAESAAPSATPTAVSRASSPTRSHSSHSAQTLADRDVQDLEKGDLRKQLKTNDGGNGGGAASDAGDAHDDEEQGSGGEKQQEKKKGDGEKDPFHVTPEGRMHLHPHTWNVAYRWFIVSDPAPLRSTPWL